VSERRDLLELLQEARRSARDRRKDFLAIYGLLLLLTLVLVLLAAFRSALYGGFGQELKGTVLRPIVAATGFARGAFEEGRLDLLGFALLSFWGAGHLVSSFFGLAITRMAAVELTGRRRADVSEALRFALGHWFWRFLTPVSLLLAALLMTGLAAALFSGGRLSDLAVVLAAPIGLLLAAGAAVVLAGLFAGGILAAPAIATEWSDAFDAVTRVYGYSFGHAYRLFLYRAAGMFALCLAAATRAARAVVTLLLFGGALVVGLGRERATRLLDSVLLEPPDAPPLPQSIASWALLFCAAVFVTTLLARLAVFRLVLHQGVYLLLRLRVDKVPLTAIDGYKPDDTAYDATAQGFDLVEMEEEIRAE